MNEKREEIIQNYVEGYNAFDIEKMTHDLHYEITFQNVQNGQLNMTLNGIDEFKQQAEHVKHYFISREQKITAIKHDGEKTEIEIDYFAVLKSGLSDVADKVNKVELKGRSVFTFLGKKIISITDIS